ncbi:MAG: DNA polymerase III subunit delta [Mycoplasma sp.]
MINVIQYIDLISSKEKILNKLKSNGINDEEVSHINYIDNENLELEIMQNNLFSPTKAFMIYDSDFLNNAKKFETSHDLIKSISSIGNDFDLYILINKKQLSNQTFKTLTKDWLFSVEKEIDQKEKINIINDELAKESIFLNKDIYAHLIKSLDCNFGNIKNEIKKLSILYKSNQPKEVLIDSICNFNDENIFELLESILLKNHQKVWTIYNDLIAKKNDEISIINAISSQIINIHYVLKFLKDGYYAKDIAPLIGIAPYFVTTYKSKFGHVDLNFTKSIILNIYNIENEIKLSKVDKRLGFKMFLLNVSENQ